MSSSGHGSEAAQPKKFLQPCLLLLIAEAPAHGYDLLERLAAFGFERDPGGLYRTLRTMERDGLVESAWELSPAGPGRRRYQLTRVGHESLQVAASAVVELSRVLDSFLDRYRTVEEEPLPVRQATRT